MSQWSGKKLSEVPWGELKIDMPVLSAIQNKGKITELLYPPADREPSIWILWEHGRSSWVFHHQADKVTCL